MGLYSQKQFLFLLVAEFSSGVSGAVAAEQLCASSVSNAPRATQPSSSSHVLRDVVLQMQRHTIDSINEVVKKIKNVLRNVSATMKQLLNK